MGDDPPPLDADPEELDSYWAETTTISVSRHTKESLDIHRDGRPWDQFLEQLRREHADPITINDISELADRLSEELRVQVDEDAIAKRTAERLEARYR